MDSEDKGSPGSGQLSDFQSLLPETLVFSELFQNSMDECV